MLLYASIFLPLLGAFVAGFFGLPKFPIDKFQINGSAKIWVRYIKMFRIKVFLFF